MWTLHTHADMSSMRLQDQEGHVLMGRFNRPRIMMDMFEYQGTKAAELAGEDYAAHNRVSLLHMLPLILAIARHLHPGYLPKAQVLGTKSSFWTPTGFCDESTAWVCLQGAGEYAHPQGVNGEGSTLQPHNRVPMDSQDGEDTGDLCIRCPAFPMQAVCQGSSSAHISSCGMFWSCCTPV